MSPSNDDAIRVLIVEDEIEAARLVTRRLSYYPSAHFVVTHVPDLRSAFTRIEQEAFEVMVLHKRRRAAPPAGGVAA
jgi:DNA-binding response OmpR family regulator